MSPARLAPGDTPLLVRGVRYPVPPLACDCHMHVFGPPDRYPGLPMRSYAPVEASLGRWQAVAGPVGLRRAVVVQPSVYGADNRCIAEAIAALGVCGRGIAQIDAGTTRPMLDVLHAAGIRGVRLNPKSVGMTDAEGFRTLLASTAARIAPLGWHVQVYAGLEMVAALADGIAASPVPVVLDHMAGARADETAELRPVLELLGRGACWVKLSGSYRVSRQESGFADALPVAKALVAANPEQLVWGTDWPHTAGHGGTPRPDAPPIRFRNMDEAVLLDTLAEAAGDEATFTRILETNPARLYAF